MEIRKRIDILKKVISILLLNKTIPLNINFSLTDKCNLSCEYCETASRNLKEMGLKDIFYIIDQLKRCGCKRIGFTGGEPLLRKDLKEIIDYTKGYHIFTTLSTNGSLIKERINDIKKLDILTVSLNGPEPIHNIQSGSDVFKRVIEGIKVAKEYKLKVYTLTVLTKYNTKIKYLESILSFVKELELSCFFQPVCDSRLFLREKKWPLPSEEEFRNAINYLISQKIQGMPINNSISCLRYFRDRWLCPDKKMKCWAGKAFFYIDTDGLLYPCLAMIKYKGYIDIFNKDLRGVLKTEKFELPHSCDCWCSTFTEIGLIFSFKMEAIRNMWRFLK